MEHLITKEHVLRRSPSGPNLFFSMYLWKICLSNLRYFRIFYIQNQITCGTVAVTIFFILSKSTHYCHKAWCNEVGYQNCPTEFISYPSALTKSSPASNYQNLEEVSTFSFDIHSSCIHTWPSSDPILQQEEVSLSFLVLFMLFSGICCF